MKTYGVIMAGGEGTRFWPLSRKKLPKQLLNLSGKEIMLNETIDRLSKVIPKQDIFIVTNVTIREQVEKVVEGRIGMGHILIEPNSRNTAICIGYAAIEILHKYGDGVMVISPSDAYIGDEEGYARILNLAIEHAMNTDNLVTIGIKPVFPSTGYGYIQYDNNVNNIVKKVVKFKEKPDYETAKKYLAENNYLWNSGMFVWKASIIIQYYEKLMPDIYQKLMKIKQAMGTRQEDAVKNQMYSSMKKISIDEGIIEHAENVVVLQGDFDWNDVGSWDMLGCLYQEDKNGNILIGEHLDIDTNNSICYSSGKMLVTVGVSNMVIVNVSDALLVCNKDQVQDIKMLVDILGNNGKMELL